MFPRIPFLCLLLSPSLLVAADPPWMTKQLAEWGEQDSRLVLSNSPWVKMATPSMLAILNSYQRREGGDMGAGSGGKGGPGLEAAQGTSLIGGKPGQPAARPEAALSRIKMQIRWESALPIRSAEFRINEPGAPVLEGDEYAIAVYGVSLRTALLEPKNAEETLKKTATLKIEWKKDVKPSRVAVIELGGGMATVVYMFPRTQPITVDDKRVDLTLQIGRYYFAQSFYPPEMQLLGKLAL